MVQPGQGPGICQEGHERVFELSSEGEGGGGGGGCLLEDQLAKVVGQQGRAMQAKGTAQAENRGMPQTVGSSVWLAHSVRGERQGSWKEKL